MTYVEDRWDRSARKGRGLRWRVRFIDPHGKERSRSFAKRVDATAFAATVSTEVMRGTYVDPKAGRITVETFAERWPRGPDRPARLDTRAVQGAHRQSHRAGPR